MEKKEYLLDMLSRFEVGSVEHNKYRLMLVDLERGDVKLHVDADTICESCQ